MGWALVGCGSSKKASKAPSPSARVSVYLGGTCGSKVASNDPLKTQLFVSSDNPDRRIDQGIAVRSDGSVLVADANHNQVLLVSADHKTVRVVLGNGTRGSKLIPSSPTETQLNLPESIAIRSDDSALVIDSGNNRVLLLSADLEQVANFAGSGESLSSGNLKLVANDPQRSAILRPSGLAIRADGSTLIGVGSRDNAPGRLLLVSPDDRKISVFAQADNLDPETLAVLSKGSVLVGQSLIAKPPEILRVSAITYTPRPFFHTTDIAPLGLAIEPDGSILTTTDATILRVSSDGEHFTRIAGNGDRYSNAFDSNDPTKTGMEPTGLAIKQDGSVLVNDDSHCRVLQIKSP